MIFATSRCSYNVPSCIGRLRIFPNSLQVLSFRAYRRMSCKLTPGFPVVGRGLGVRTELGEHLSEDLGEPEPVQAVHRKVSGGIQD